MASGMLEGCFICDEIEKIEKNEKYITRIEKYSTRIEPVFPRVKRRYLVITSEDGPEYNEYIDVYDVFTLRDGAGNNLKRRVHLFQKYLVEFRYGQIYTQDSEIGQTVVAFQDNKPYDRKKQYNVTFAECQRCQVGIFQLTPVIFDEQNPNLEEVDI